MKSKRPDSTEPSSIPEVGDAWKAPSSREQGSPTDDEVYHSVGRALTAWENTEFAFATIFGLLSESRTGAAARAYGTLQGPMPRIQMLREAGNVYKASNAGWGRFEDLDRLIRHYKEAAALRNQIAHGVVMEFLIDEKSRGFFLVPAMYNSKGHAFKGPEFWDQVSRSEDPFTVFGINYRYSHLDVDDIHLRFQTLYSHANRIGMHLMGFVVSTEFDRVPAANKVSITLGGSDIPP